MMLDWLDHRDPTKRISKEQKTSYMRYAVDRQRMSMGDEESRKRMHDISKSFPENWTLALHHSFSDCGWEELEKKMGWSARSGRLALYTMCDGLSYFYKDTPNTIG